MTKDPDELTDLVREAADGDPTAQVELFTRHRDQLRRMVRLRLDQRLQGRLDPSDVLQEAYLDFQRRLPEYAGQPSQPFYLWLRGLTLQRLIDLHRAHLGAQARNATREVAQSCGSSEMVAAQLVGWLTSPSQAAQRAELQRSVQAVLARLDPLDREVLTLRHFEMLSNSEVAQLLGLKKTTASKRYVTALQRLKEALGDWGADAVQAGR